MFRWGRAMVVNKSDKELELFFVDYGDFADVGWDDVKNIYPELIRRLPFQVNSFNMFSYLLYHLPCILSIFMILFLAKYTPE